ncbi:TetR/AcrR family transcriptional regulator [Lacibacterium aquatile]|uniref:TetR/AcrR family transcriptional regulator n=1 Tax=Lacibacterium aquatile TaxID=1168082 RepID=A0ABW5DU02_9PROT
MRTRKPGRRADIARAALTVFTRQGFRLTQMADVAREAGVSAGTLYSYVEGKEALFELALQVALERLPLDEEELRLVGPSALGAWLTGELRGAVNWPRLMTATRTGMPIPKPEPVIEELFDLLTRHRHLIWLLDRCANEIPELAGVYESEVRDRYIAKFAAFVGRSPAFQRAEPGVTAATARALMEMVAWMAMHRLRDRLPPACTTEEAKQAVVAIATGRLSGTP